MTLPEVGVDAVLQRGDPALLEPGRRLSETTMVGEFAQCPAPPQLEPDRERHEAYKACVDRYVGRTP